MAQRTAAPRSLWPLVKTESKAQKIDSEWYAESRCETRFLYHPFYRTFTPAAARLAALIVNRPEEQDRHFPG